MATFGALQAEKSLHEMRPVVLVADIDGHCIWVADDAVARDLEPPDRLPDTECSSNDQEVSRPEPSPEHIIQRLEAGWHWAQMGHATLGSSIFLGLHYLR
jgi:hypothetical protein